MSTPTLDCAILTTEAEVYALADEWRALHKRLNATPFMDFDWFTIWWETLGRAAGRNLHIITGRVNGQLVALLPLSILTRKGFRMLQGIGVEPMYYGDMLCNDMDYAKTLWQVAHSSKLYDFAHLRDIFGGSICDQVLSAATYAQLTESGNAYYLDLTWKSGEEWKAETPISSRKSLARRTRRLAEKGKLAYHVCTHLPVPMDIIDGMVAEKTSWCVKNNLPGPFAEKGILDFYHKIANEEAKHGTIILGWLTCGEAVISYHLMFACGQKIYSYTMATHADWLAFSPGNLAHINAISWAIDHGFTEFDHMQGDFAYKREFSNGARQAKEYMFSHSLRGWLGKQLFLKRRALKKYLATKNK